MVVMQKLTPNELFFHVILYTPSALKEYKSSSA
mgnify:CR=1 FL=1